MWSQPFTELLAKPLMVVHVTKRRVTMTKGFSSSKLGQVGYLTPPGLYLFLEHRDFYPRKIDICQKNLSPFQKYK